MLSKAVASIEADELVALEMFNKGDGGFRQGDLHPLCFRISDGKLVASPIAVLSGTDIRTLEDSASKAFRVEQYAVALQKVWVITNKSAELAFRMWNKG
jgi:hypothetical protein